MKFFQSCLRNTCEQLRFRYEQQAHAYQRLHILYSQCVEDSFRSLGLFTNEQISSNQQDNDNIIGGGIVIGNPKSTANSQFSLSNSYNKIVQVYENCFKTQGQNLEELDQFKDCQINCLDEAIKKSESVSSSSTLSTNLIIVIVFSVIGFALILFLIYKCEQMMRRQREHRHQLEQEEQQNYDYDNDDNVIDQEKSEIEYQKQRLYQQPRNQISNNSKRKQYAPKLNGALSRLNVNKMKEIVNNMKNENPELDQIQELEDDEQGNLKKMWTKKVKNQNLINNSCTMRNDYTRMNMPSSSSSIARNNKRRSTDSSTHIMNQNLTTQSQFNQSQLLHSLAGSSILSFKTGSVISQSYLTTINQQNFSPKINFLDNNSHFENFLIDEKQKQQQENQMERINTQKEYNSNDKTQPFACYDQQHAFTSPCEAYEKQNKNNSFINIPQPIILKTESCIMPNKGSNTQNCPQEEYAKGSQASPINSCETNENTNESPEYLQRKGYNLKDKVIFQLNDQIGSQNVFSQQQSLNQISKYSSKMRFDDEEEEEEEEQDKVTQIENNKNNSSTQRNLKDKKVKSLFEMDLQNTYTSKKCETYS